MGYIYCEKTNFKYDTKDIFEISLEIFKNLEKYTSKNKFLFFSFCENSLIPFLLYLFCKKNNQTIALLDKKLDFSLKRNLIEKYKPTFILDSTLLKEIYKELNYKLFLTFEMDSEYALYVNEKNEFPLHPDLFLLLPTSGTTGSPKFVRLSYENVNINTKQILDYLPIENNDVAITNLPMFYSYGLSVINTHLEKNASIVFTRKNIFERDFWNLFKEFNITNFNGVPYHYLVLHRFKYSFKNIKFITQAGGKLNKGTKLYFYKDSIQNNYKFFIMYGQTEATARISYVPPNYLPEKIESIGIPVKYGKLFIKNGELYYQGPNVMMGYANSYLDLQKEKEVDILKTGDLGYQDEDGFFYVTSRKKRIAKVYGLRISLDDLENHIETKFTIPCLCKIKEDPLSGEKILIYLESPSKDLIDNIKNDVEQKYKIKAFQIISVNKIPIKASGKKDYKKDI